MVVASSPSLPSAAAAAALARARGARFLLEVRDLWPDSAIAMGLVNDRRTIAAARALESYCYRRADRIVALTEGIRDGMIDQGVSPAKITLITNGVDLEIGSAAARPGRAGARARPTRSWRCTSAPTAPTARSRPCSTPPTGCATCPGARDGPGGRRRPEAGAGGGGRTALASTNVVFIDSVPKREVPSWLARADVCLLPYQDNPLFAGALPNKAFDYLGAARPIIAAAPTGELTAMVERAGCGVAVPPGGRRGAGGGDPPAGRRPRGRRRMGASGRGLRPGALRPRRPGGPLRRGGRVACLSPGPIGGRAKRALDLAVALPLAIALTPVMAVVAVLVRRDSPGPALFRQQRIGYAGRPFTLLKFRTMVVGAEGMGAGLAVTVGDSRITPLGATLRRLSLDELPAALEHRPRRHEPGGPPARPSPRRSSATTPVSAAACWRARA